MPSEPYTSQLAMRSQVFRKTCTLFGCVSGWPQPVLRQLGLACARTTPAAAVTTRRSIGWTRRSDTQCSANLFSLHQTRCSSSSPELEAVLMPASVHCLQRDATGLLQLGKVRLSHRLVSNNGDADGVVVDSQGVGASFCQHVRIHACMSSAPRRLTLGMTTRPCASDDVSTFSKITVAPMP